MYVMGTPWCMYVSDDYISVHYRHNYHGTNSLSLFVNYNNLNMYTPFMDLVYYCTCNHPIVSSWFDIITSPCDILVQIPIPFNQIIIAEASLKRGAAMSMQLFLARNLL